eukprot:COSAG05_NODE_14995_length_381_cov_0.751773_1_plen_20_part_10
MNERVGVNESVGVCVDDVAF